MTVPIADFVTDLFNPDLAFLQRAVVITVIASVLCGIVGCHVVLRGMAFIGDAVAHEVFPGLAVAFVIQGSLVLGGAVAGVLTAVLVAVFAQNRRLEGGLGHRRVPRGLLRPRPRRHLTRAPGYAGSLQQFLFGSITGIPCAGRALITAIAVVGVLSVVAVLHRQLVTVVPTGRWPGPWDWRPSGLTSRSNVCVTLAVVVSLQTVGNILVLALLVTPAATARLLTDRLGVMMVLSPLIGRVRRP